jgi:hypothetical protein
MCSSVHKNLKFAPFHIVSNFKNLEIFQMHPYFFVAVEILIIFVTVFAQRDSGGKLNILETDSIGHCKKKVHVNIYLFLKDYRVTAVAIWRALFR